MTELTKDEKQFLDRAAILMADNPDLSPIDAMKQTLARDEQLWLLVAGKSDEAQLIRDAMAREVYMRIRADA